MDYPNKTFTNAGADLMAADDANSQATVVDKMIVSQSLPDESGEPLDEVTVDDFDNPMNFQIDNYKHQNSTFQVEAVLNNKGLQQDYPINMIGLLAHSQNANNDNEVLLAVATADEPFILPKETNTPFNFTIGMALTYKNSNNITAVLSDAGTVDVQDLKTFKKWVKHIITIAIGTGVNQAADSFAINSQHINSLASNQSDFTSSASSNINNIDSDVMSMSVANSNLASSANHGLSMNSAVINATINQLGLNDEVINGSLSSLNSSVASNSSLIAATSNNNVEYANSNANDISKQFKILLTAFNQLATDNRALRKQLLG